MTTEPLPVTENATYVPGTPFEAKVIHEAALACSMARLHNCTIEIHIGARFGKRPVDVKIIPNEIG